MDSSTRTFFIAGVQFRPKADTDMVRKGLVNSGLGDGKITIAEVGVDLVGEPKNQYDKYAVKCLIGGTFIGYIPKPINIDIWALRDMGYKPSAHLVEFYADAPTHLMYKVQVDFTKTPTK